MSITKFHYISRPTTFILVFFPSKVVWKIQILKFKHSFAWQDDFKPKHCQLQSFIILHYLQHVGGFFFRGCFQNSNFKFFKFRRSFRWQYDFKWKSCQLQTSLLKIYKVYFGCLVIYSSHMMVLTICTNSICLYERDRFYEQIYFYFVISRNVQNINYTSWWVIQICSSKLFHLN